MDRRRFVLTAASLLAAPLAAAAQQAGGVHRIGFLTSGSATASWRAVDAFRQGLRERGWVEGQNIVIDYRSAEGVFDQLPDLAAELVRLQVQVMVAGPTPAAVAAKNATREIPIVMWAVGDPVGLGLIASLARPGGNDGEDLLHRHIFDDAVAFIGGSSFHWIRWRRPRGYTASLGVRRARRTNSSRRWASRSAVSTHSGDSARAKMNPG
jgi:hypothetical protein